MSVIVSKNGIDPYSYEVDEPIYIEDDHPFSGLLEEG